jgi:hypothetical protein
MSKPAKGPARKAAEKAVDRRRTNVIAAAQAYVLAFSTGNETRAILGNLREAVSDLDQARAHLNTIEVTS